MIRLLCFLLAISAAGVQDRDLPRVLCFADPQGSDNNIVRRREKEVPSTAERYFLEYAKGVFDATVTQDPAEVGRHRLPRYRAVVFFTAGNPPLDKEGLVEWVKNGGAFTGIHSTANTFQG